MSGILPLMLDALDGNTYRLFGGNWRSHYATSTKKIHEHDGDLTIVVYSFERTLFAATLKADGTREIEVHPESASCQAWRITHSTCRDCPDIKATSGCHPGKSFDALPRQYEQELNLAVDALYRMASLGTGCDAQAILDALIKVEEWTFCDPDRDRWHNGFRRILEGGYPHHQFHFAGTVYALQQLRRQLI